MEETPRHAARRARLDPTWIVLILVILCVLAVAWAAPQVLADGESAVRLLAFLIDLARIALG